MFLRALVVLLALSVEFTLAQSTSARIVGTVRDQSGAVVPNVAVEAVSVETAAVRITQANDAGDYVLAALPPGSYRISAKVPGFKQYARGPLQVVVDQTARVDIDLQAGDVAESISVEASAPVVNSETSAVGQIVEEVQIKGLPLNGRNFIQLGLLAPGTSPGRDATVNSRQGGISISANGQPPDQNNWLLDGVDNNAAMFGLAVIVPSVEALQEFRVQTSNYSAEYGRAAGAVVNAQIKSGSNDWHGSLYEFLRNDNFDARRYFDVGKPPLAYNQFGGSVGGPVVRNRTFFFFNYEGQRIRRGITAGGRVPTQAMKRGDFSGEPVIYDPLTLDPATNRRQVFPNNVIPTDRIHPASRRILSYFPDPNNSDPARNFVRSATNIDDGDQWHLRGDHKLSDKQWIMGRFSLFNTDGRTENGLPTDADLLSNRHRAFVVQHTGNFRPNVINEFRLGGNRYFLTLFPENQGAPLTEQLGLPSLVKGTPLDGFPDLRVAGLPRLGGNAATPLDRVENTWQFVDSVTWIRGAHSVKLGGDLRVYRSENEQLQFGRGRYTFSGVFTGQVGSTYRDGFGDFLLGFPSEQILLNPQFATANSPRNQRYSLYVQDDWKVHSRLTMNLGLRWERDGDWTEAENRWGAFDTSRGEVVYARDYEIPFALPFPHRFGDSNVMQKGLNSWSPRVGLAYRPLGTARLVVRAAYGIFWGQSIGKDLVNTSLQVPPGQIQDRIVSGSTTPTGRFGEFSVTGGDPSRSIPANPSFLTIPHNLRQNSSVQQWNFGIETELTASTGLSVSYVGSKGTSLASQYEANPALPPSAGALQARRRFPRFGVITMTDSDAFSSYNALQIKAERRFRNGLSFLTGYTWGKAIDNLGPHQNSANRVASKGVSTQDLRQRFTLAAVYQLPFGTGQALLSGGSPFVRALASGWQLNTIVTLRTGLPFTATVPGDTANAAAGTVFPNVTGERNGNLPGSERSIERWFDTAAFTRPAPFTFGTAGRNTLTGPGSETVDLGLLRSFAVREAHRVQFRAEFFNLLNHASFGLPNAGVGAVGFGVIRSTGQSREVQLALKYQF